MALPCGLCRARSRSAGNACLVPRNTPVRLTAQSRCHSSRLASSIPLPRNSPALLTRMSSPPKRAVVAAIAAVQSSSLVTSRCVYVAASVEPAITRAVSRPRSSSTSPIATLAPASTISCAVAAPMPRAAPEIKATLPSRRFISLLLAHDPRCLRVSAMMPRRTPKRIENMNIERLDHLVLTVADITSTCEFYTRVLGMEVVTFGEGRTALRFGQQKINLHLAGNIPGLVADKPTPGSGDLCFITKVALADVTAHLEQCGISVIAGPGPRAGAIGTIQSVYIRDPDQNLVEISNY